MKTIMPIDQSDKLLDRLIDSNIDYLFWILLILYSNPGGIFNALNIWYITAKFNVLDLLFILLSVCYLIIPKSHNIFDSDFRKIRTYILLFATYYFIAFVYVIPILNGKENYSLLTALIKSRWAIHSFLLFIYIYEFFKRKPEVFLKLFIFSSVAILTLFLLQTVMKLHILPTDIVGRGFVKINRIMFISDGFMYFLIPIGITIIIFNLNIRNKKIILIGFGLMILYYIVTLFRRYLMAIIIFFILAILINIFISGRYEVLIKNTVKVLSIAIFITIGTYIVFPKYVYAAGDSIMQTFNVFFYEKTTTGTKDVRMTLDRPFINEKFYDHPIFGTGFDNRWRTKAGDEQGYEALDYPFLAAMGMFGIVGIIVFLPVYFCLFSVLWKDIKYLRNERFRNKPLFFLFLITFILYFLCDFTQYFNYFSPISDAGGYLWYTALSFYLASRYLFYSTSFQNDLIHPNYVSTLA